MGRVKGTFSSQNDQFFVHHSDISFLSLFVTTSQTFFILDILDIGELKLRQSDRLPISVKKGMGGASVLDINIVFTVYR